MSVVVVELLVLLVVGASVLVVDDVLGVAVLLVVVDGAAVVLVGAPVVLVVGAAVVLVEELVVAVVGGVVVEVLPHVNEPSADPDAAHASSGPRQSHLSPLLRSEQRVSPPFVTRQQLTLSVPQLERIAHAVTSLWHSRGREPAAARARATPATQLTYAPRLAALAQSHSAEAAACAAATAAVSSHALAPACVGKATIPSAATNIANMSCFICVPFLRLVEPRGVCLHTYPVSKTAREVP